MQKTEFINKIFVTEQQWVQLLRKYVCEVCNTGTNKDVVDDIMNIRYLQDNYDLVDICMSLTADELIAFFVKNPTLYPTRLVEVVTRTIENNIEPKQQTGKMYTKVLSVDHVHATIEVLKQNKDYKVLHLPNYKSINDYLCPRSVHEKYSSERIAYESIYTVFKYEYSGCDYYQLWNNKTKQQLTSFVDLWSLVDYHVKNGVSLYHLIEGWKRLQLNGSTDVRTVELNKISVQPELGLVGSRENENISIRVKNLLNKYGEKLFRYDRFVNEEHELLMRDEMLDLNNEALKDFYCEIDAIYA